MGLTKTVVTTAAILTVGIALVGCGGKGNTWSWRNWHWRHAENETPVTEQVACNELGYYPYYTPVYSEVVYPVYQPVYVAPVAVHWYAPTTWTWFHRGGERGGWFGGRGRECGGRGGRR